MTYSAKAIANLIIDTAKEHGGTVDQLKLQKLVYITHGWHLAINESPLIDDVIEAWKDGPVIPTLYDEFKNCGRDPIVDYATDVEVNEQDLSFRLYPPMIADDDQDTRLLVQKIWQKYGGLTGPQLSNLTHLPNTPWDQVYKVVPKGQISNHLIQNHFVELATSTAA